MGRIDWQVIVIFAFAAGVALGAGVVWWVHP